MRIEDDPMYPAAERIMKAAGSPLRHYTPETKTAILHAVRDEFSRAYIAGSNGLWDALQAGRKDVSS